MSSNHPSTDAIDGPPPPPPPASTHNHNGSAQSPGSPPAAFPDGDDINTFWPPEPRPAPPAPGALPDPATTSTSAELALAAVKADPFKSVRASSSSSASPPAAGAGSSSGNANASRAYQQGNKFSATLPVFPGQQQNREIGKPTSALRTSEGSPTNGRLPYEESAVGDTTSYSEAVDQSGAVRRDATTEDAEGNSSNHANYFAHTQDVQDQGSSSSYPPQRDHSQAVGPPTPGASDADTSMMSQQGYPTNPNAYHKKRKPYKYLQDEPADAASKPRGEKRKKVQKACRPCKRSHMPCEAVRPCPRCIKRGIPELCVDAEPITRRPGRKANNATANTSVEVSEPPEDASEIEQLARAAQAMRSPITSASIIASTSAAGTVGDDGGPPRSLPPRAYASSLDPARVQTLQEALVSADEDLLDLFGGDPLSILADPTLPLAVPVGEGIPFSHTRSYSRLARWAISQLPEHVAAELDPITGSARGHFLQVVQNVQPPLEFDQYEADFQNSIPPQSSEGQTWMDMVPVPTLFARRSGEIYAINDAFSQATGLPKSALCSGELNLIQLGPDARAVEVAKLLTNSQVFCLGETVSANVALNLSSVKATLEDDKAALSNPSSSRERLYVVSLKTSEWRDGLPLAVTCTLTPVATLTPSASIRS